MRDTWRGALGAAFVYPLVWYYAAADPPSPGNAPAARAAKPSAQAARSATGEEKPAQEQPAWLEPSTPRASGEASTAERITEPVPPTALAPGAPGRPSVEEPRVRDPRVPMPDFEELRDTLARVGEVQQHAHAPAELDHRVQTLEEDPAKLARLKAFAEMLVELPPSRVDHYLPASGDGARPAGSR